MQKGFFFLLFISISIFSNQFIYSYVDYHYYQSPRSHLDVPAPPPLSYYQRVMPFDGYFISKYSVAQLEKASNAFTVIGKFLLMSGVGGSCIAYKRYRDARRLFKNKTKKLRRELTEAKHELNNKSTDALIDTCKHSEMLQDITTKELRLYKHQTQIVKYQGTFLQVLFGLGGLSLLASVYARKLEKVKREKVTNEMGSLFLSLLSLVVTLYIG